MLINNAIKRARQTTKNAFSNAPRALERSGRDIKEVTAMQIRWFCFVFKFYKRVCLRVWLWVLSRKFLRLGFSQSESWLLESFSSTELDETCVCWKTFWGWWLESDFHTIEYLRLGSVCWKWVLLNLKLYRLWWLHSSQAAFKSPQHKVDIMSCKSKLHILRLGLKTIRVRKDHVNRKSVIFIKSFCFNSILGSTNSKAGQKTIKNPLNPSSQGATWQVSHLKPVKSDDNKNQNCNLLWKPLKNQFS